MTILKGDKTLSLGQVVSEVLEVKKKKGVRWKKIGKTIALIYILYLIASLSIIYVSTNKTVKNLSLYTLDIKRGIKNLLAYNLTIAMQLFENASKHLNEAYLNFKRTEILRFTNILLTIWYFISSKQKERLVAINEIFIISEFMANGSQNIVTSLNWTIDAVNLAVKSERFLDAINTIEKANSKALEAVSNFGQAIDLLDIDYTKLSEKERNATIALNNTLQEMFLLAKHLNIITYSMKQLIIAIESSKKAYDEMSSEETNFNNLRTYSLNLSIALTEFEERKINETAKEFFTDLVYCMCMAYKWLLNIQNALNLSIRSEETSPYKEWILENYTLLCAEFEYLTEI